MTDINVRYWSPQFGVLLVILATTVAVAFGIVGSTVGFVVVVGALCFDLGFSVAHQLRTAAV